MKKKGQIVKNKLDEDCSFLEEKDCNLQLEFLQS